MKYAVQQLIDMESLIPGMVLEDDIYHINSDVILCKRGTVLTQSKIERLKKFENVVLLKKHIEDSSIKSSNKDIIIKNIALDFKELHRIAKYIVISVLNRSDIKRILKKVDKTTYSHSYHVAIISIMIGINLENFDKLCLEELAITAILHDIGKSIINPDILNKSGALTAKEYEIIKLHPKLGYDILNETGLFSKDICQSVLAHHENEGGSGYPEHKKEDEIPLYARIVHLADVYSALISHRSYKTGWSANEAIEQLEKEHYKYESHLLDVLKKILPIYFKDDLVYLSNGELATVFDVDQDRITVKIFGDKKIVNLETNNTKVYIKRKINVG